MKFNKKVENFNKKQARKKKIQDVLEENLWSIIDEVRDFKSKQKLKRNIRNIEKLKNISLNEMIGKVERDLLRCNPGDKVYVYKDAELDYSVMSIKHTFTNSWVSSCPTCITYNRTMRHLNKKVDFDYFYNAIYEYFSSYEDLEVQYTIDKAWERNQVIASELECFYIVRKKDSNNLK